MRNRILEIVVFLIDFMQGNKGRLASSEELSSLLEAEGYSEDEISSAYSWLLQRFDSAPEQFYANFPKTSTSVRILTQTERMQLSTEAYDFLLKMLNLSLIDNEQFEAILERSAMIGPRLINLEQMKLIASSVVLADMDELDSLTMTGEADDLSPRIN